MSEIVERVAKALSDRRQVRAYGRVLTMWRAPEMCMTVVEERLDDAKTMIEAMREPTEAMLCPLYGSAHGPAPYLEAKALWQAMIDGALE